MLRIARGAAVAAGQDLAFAEQGIDHGLSGLFDAGSERFHRLLLGFDAGLEKLANTGLHVHRYLTFKVTGRPRGACHKRTVEVDEGNNDVGRDCLAAVESVADPVRLLLFSGLACGCDIEAAWMLRQTALLLKKQLGGPDQLLPFAQVDAFQGATPGAVAAVTNLDEYYCIAIEHDQIELSAATCPVTLEQAQALTLQITLGELLGSPAAVPAVFTQRDNP